MIFASTVYGEARGSGGTGRRDVNPRWAEGRAPVFETASQLFYSDIR